MANSFYFIDGDGNTRTLYIAGTSTDKFAQPGSEQGEHAPISEVYEEQTPNRLSNQYRGTIYKGRIYKFTALLKGATPTALETLIGTWNDWHDPELGEGYVKRITIGGTTLCLDCIPLPPDYSPAPGGSVATILVTQAYKASNPWWRDESLNSGTDDFNQDVAVANGTLEAGGTGGDFNGGAELDDGTSDDFTSWTEAGVNDGAGDKVEGTATVHAGSAAAKMTQTAGQTSIQSVNLTVVAEQTYRLTFWTRGDGTNQGQYSIYDVTNGADIDVATNTGVTGTDYTEVTVDFDTPASCVSVYVKLYSPSGAGVAYFDDVTLTQRTVDVSCNNQGDIPAWPYIVITGIVNTPRITNSDDDYVEVSKTTTNADDEIRIDYRPNGANRGTVKFYEHGTGSGTFCQVTSASKRITLPKGNNAVTLSATSGTPAGVIYWYNYYRSLK